MPEPSDKRGTYQHQADAESLRTYPAIVAAEEERADRAEAEVERLRELLRDVATSGVSYEEPRVHYLEVQIDRPTWEELAEFRPAPDITAPPSDDAA